MAQIMNATVGNWSNPATWVGGVVPGPGDTVVILAHTVTIDVDVTIGAGNGVWVPGGNPAAIMTVGGYAQLVVAAGKTLTCRGDFVFHTWQNADTFGLTLIAGATFQFDSSTTSPPTTSYSFRPGNNGVYGCKLICNGTQGNPCTVTSVAGGANGGFQSGGFGDFGTLTASWTTFRNLGSSSVPMWVTSFNGSIVTVNVSHCTFDGCGPLNVVTTNPTVGQCDFTDCIWVNSLATYNTQLLLNANYTRCVFDRTNGTNLLQDNLTYTNCYLGESFTNGGQTDAQGAFTNNLVRAIQRDAPQLTSQNVSNCLWVGDHNQTDPNMFGNGLKAQVVDGVVFEYTNDAGNGCSFIALNQPSTPGAVYEIKHSLCVPNAAGQNSCSILSIDRSFGNGVVSLHHNTGTMMGRCVSVDEAGDNNPDVISLLANNLVYAPLTWAATDSFVVDAGHTHWGPSQVDNVSPDNIRTNNVFGSYLSSYSARTWYTNQANGYGAAFSSTPGTTDLHEDPKFKDSTRNLALFDSRYLGHVANSTWASHDDSDTFNVGDIVSNNNPIYYNGAAINFRCIQPHAKGASGTEPGGDFSSDWRDYWEFASLYSIRTAVTGGASGNAQAITDATLGLTNVDYITAIIAWIRDGFAPTNQALVAAGYDATDIGAVPVQQGIVSSSRNFLLMGIHSKRRNVLTHSG